MLQNATSMHVSDSNSYASWNNKAEQGVFGNNNIFFLIKCREEAFITIYVLSRDNWELAKIKYSHTSLYYLNYQIQLFIKHV